jgi:hypothetical protein
MVGEVLCSKHNALRKPTDMIKVGVKWICKPHLPCSSELQLGQAAVLTTASTPVAVYEVPTDPSRNSLEDHNRKRSREEATDSRKRTRVPDAEVDNTGTALIEDVAGSPTNDSLPLHRRLEGRAPTAAHTFTARTTSPVEVSEAEPNSPPRNHYHYFEADDLHPSLLGPTEDEGPAEDDSGKPLNAGTDTKQGESSGPSGLKVSRVQISDGSPSSGPKVNTSSPIFSDGLRALTSTTSAADLAGGDWTPEIRLISKPLSFSVKSALKRPKDPEGSSGSPLPPGDRTGGADHRLSSSQKKSLRWAVEVRFIERTLDTEPRVARGILRTSSFPTSLTPSTVGRGLGKGVDGKKPDKATDASPSGDGGKPKPSTKAEAAVDGKFRDGFRRFCFVSAEPNGIDNGSETKGIIDRSPPEWLLRLRKDATATNRIILSLPEGLSVG